MHHVFAYLDPGSASLIFQGAIAALIAVPVIFRNKISQVIRAARGGSTETTESVAEAPATGEPTTSDTPVR